MRHFLIHLIFHFSAFSCYGITNAVETTNKIAIHLNNEGSLGGKANSEFWRNDGLPLNNHGFFYNSSQLECSLLNTITIKTRLRVWNPELSLFDRYEYLFEPEIALALRTKHFETFIRGGYINDFTLGNGLTVKDFSNSGAIADMHWNKWSGSAGIFTRGYGVLEDLYWMSLNRGSIPLKITALVSNTQGTVMMGSFGGERYYLSGYLLPSMGVNVPCGVFYAEYGFKLNRHKNIAGLIEESPGNAHAGLFGFKTDYHGKRFSFDGCMEFRAYRKGFIPVTGVDMSRFNTFWDEDDSRANWIDFFDSRETSYWAYTRIHADCLVYNNWRFFVRDELLYFCSTQKEAVVYPAQYDGPIYEGAVLAYKPSTHFYAVGIRYKVTRGVTGEISIGNKLTNGIWMGKDMSYTQWGQRFIAADCPFWEVRIKWNI